MGLSVIFIFKCTQLPCVLREILKKMMDSELSLPLSEFYVSCTFYVYTLCSKLTNCYISGSTLSTMITGDCWWSLPDYTSKNYVCLHVLFCANCVCAILIPVRVLLVTWCLLLINSKHKNSTGEFWVLSLGFPS